MNLQRQRSPCCRASASPFTRRPLRLSSGSLFASRNAATRVYFIYQAWMNDRPPNPGFTVITNTKSTVKTAEMALTVLLMTTSALRLLLLMLEARGGYVALLPREHRDVVCSSFLANCGMKRSALYH